MSSIEPFEYDEDDAVKFIRNHLPQELKNRFSDNDINYIIDVMYDFYDEKGLMDEDASDDDTADLNEDELLEYVVKNIQKDKLLKLTEEEIGFIVQGELAYCESLGMFE
ncbi:MAG: hypothetical protein LBR34_08155 [Prevotella sp.]|jgi:hypothetical protein|nr:hypothetical protein [Prevotella sp.]